METKGLIAFPRTLDFCHLNESTWPKSLDLLCYTYYKTRSTCFAGNRLPQISLVLINWSKRFVFAVSFLFRKHKQRTKDTCVDELCDGIREGGRYETEILTIGYR